MEGNSGELELEDMSPDGGTALGATRSSSGRRVKADSVPKVIRWMSKRPFLDYETACRRTVSDRFRAQIEDLEPGVHQFVPIEFISKDSEPLGIRWFWQVCNRIDSVHRARTNYRLDSTLWRGPLIGDAVLVFDTGKINQVAIWHDKHLLGGPYLTDEAKRRIEHAGITGVHFLHFDQA
jgi:hypothetical protein